MILGREICEQLGELTYRYAVSGEAMEYESAVIAVGARKAAAAFTERVGLGEKRGLPDVDIRDLESRTTQEPTTNTAFIEYRWSPRETRAVFLSGPLAGRVLELARPRLAVTGASLGEGYLSSGPPKDPISTVDPEKVDYEWTAWDTAERHWVYAPVEGD